MSKVDVLKYSDLSEEEIINLLRDNKFVTNSDSLVITTLLSNLSFKYIFNFLQSDNIYNKCDTLNFSLLNTDRYLISGFLESVRLCVKLDSRMYYKLMIKLSSDDIINFITKDYIINNLSDNELVNLLVVKNIGLVSLKDLLGSRINQDFLVNYLNKLWELKFDSEVIKDIDLLKILFNLDDKLVKKINIDDIDYLITTILNKESLGLNNSLITVLSIKSLIMCYLLLGLNKTIELLFSDNNILSIDELNKYLDYYIESRMSDYLVNEGVYLDKLDDNIIKLFNNHDTEIKISYLDSKMFNYLDKFRIDKSKLLKVINRYINYHYVNLDDAILEVREYVSGLKNDHYNYIRDLFTKDYFRLIKSYIKIKKNAKSKRLKEVNDKLVLSIKYKLFIKLLNNSINDEELFSKSVDVNKLVNSFKEYINEYISFNEYIKNVLTPLSFNSFDVEDYLRVNDFVKPSNYEYFEELMNLKKKINDFNKYLRKLKKKKSINDLGELSDRFMSEYKDFDLVYDYKSNKIVHNNLVNSYIDSDCMNYYNAYKVINEILLKTNKLIKRLFKTSRIMDLYYDELHHNIDSLTLTDYMPVTKLFNLNDLEVLFKGLSFNELFDFNDKYYKYLVNNKIHMLLFAGIINNPSRIISNSKAITDYDNLSVIEFINMNNKLNNNIINDVFGYNINYYNDLDNESINELFKRSIRNYEKYIFNVYISSDNFIIRSMSNYEVLKYLINSDNHNRSTHLESFDDVVVTYYELISKESRIVFKTLLDGNNLIVEGDVVDHYLEVFSDYILNNYKDISYVTTNNLEYTNYLTNYLNHDLAIIKCRDDEYSNTYHGELLNIVGDSFIFTNSIINKKLFKRIKLLYNEALDEFDELYFDNYNVIIKYNGVINQKISNYIKVN